MLRRPYLLLCLSAWPLLAVSCLLTAPSDDEIVSSCDDDQKNGGETDADCGGPCGKCGTGRTCESAADCASGVCAGDVCEAPSCNDGVQNGNEPDIDCGADPDCAFCADGRHCNIDDDCESYACVDEVCVQPSCNDGILNGDESDLDCGAACPTKCAQGQDCFDGTDCASGMCDVNTAVCL